MPNLLKTFLFKHMKYEDEARRACDALNNSTFDGRTIHLEFSTSKLRKAPGMDEVCFRCGDKTHKWVETAFSLFWIFNPIIYIQNKRLPNARYDSGYKGNRFQTSWWSRVSLIYLAYICKSSFFNVCFVYIIYNVIFVYCIIIKTVARVICRIRDAAPPPKRVECFFTPSRELVQSGLSREFVPPSQPIQQTTVVAAPMPQVVHPPTVTLYPDPILQRPFDRWF